MDIQQINEIVDNCLIPDTCKNIRYHERKNYWLIEGDNFFYKIYKPFKNSDIDCSTPEKRCEVINNELALNKRLASKIYYKIIAVKQLENNEEIIENSDGNIIDYALVIRKVNQENNLKNIIDSNKLTSDHIREIAIKVADFHSRARVVKNVFGITAFQKDLEQILHYKELIEDQYGSDSLELIEMLLNDSNKYLNRNRNFFNDRTILGYIKNGHGAIIPENIYFNNNKISITDCKSISDSQRYIDVLNDIATLGMELDSLGLNELAEKFYANYIAYSKTENSDKAHELYRYYKKYQALKTITNKLEKGYSADRYLKVLYKYEPEIVNS